MILKVGKLLTLRSSIEELTQDKNSGERGEERIRSGINSIGFRMKRENAHELCWI